MQDHDRGLIVGQTSWGKGLVQSVYTLSDGAGLALTSAKYYTPSGRCIQRDYKDVLEYLSPEDEEGTTPTRAAGARRPPSRRGDLPDRRGPHRLRRRRHHARRLRQAPTALALRATLYARGLFFEFAVDYRAKHSDIPRDFQVTDAVREDFFRFLDGKPGPWFDKGAKATCGRGEGPEGRRPRDPRGAPDGRLRARGRLPGLPRGRRPAEEGAHALPRRREARDGPRGDAARPEVRPQGAGQAVEPRLLNPSSASTFPSLPPRAPLRRGGGRVARRADEQPPENEGVAKQPARR